MTSVKYKTYVFSLFGAQSALALRALCLCPAVFRFAKI